MVTLEIGRPTGVRLCVLVEDVLTKGPSGPRVFYCPYKRFLFSLVGCDKPLPSFSLLFIRNLLLRGFRPKWCSTHLVNINLIDSFIL